MNEKEFNLLDESWIRVIDRQCRISEISLTDAIISAHKYKSLSGETPAQDIAVMRVILAVLHTVFSRVDENGDEFQLENDDKNEAVRRWKALWEMKQFPEEPITDYLESWRERFWLFHPEYPFWQVAGLNIGTEYSASKLNGELLESGNKIRMFSAFSGETKESMPYPQAVRWLIYTNAFDDTSSKPTKINKGKYHTPDGNAPSVGAGWLGKLGLIYLTGNNLFETLMLNLVMASEYTDNNQKPVWEKENVPSEKNRILFEERNEISKPENLAELYTLQSRRILLNRDNGKVTGYRLLGGDFFNKKEKDQNGTEDAFFEPMTVWRTPKNDKKEPYKAKRHDSSKQMWREFATLYNNKDSNRCAGVITWLARCKRRCNMKNFMMKTSIVSVEYGDKDFFVQNIFSDSLSMNAVLLDDKQIKGDYLDSIEDEIKKCDSLASAVGTLAKNLIIASGGDERNTGNVASEAKSQLYYRLDLPFRKWLAGINPDNSIHETIDEWQKKAIKIADDFAEELVSATPETAFMGHEITNSKKEKELVSASKAMLIFKGSVRKIYGKIKAGKGSDKDE